MPRRGSRGDQLSSSELFLNASRRCCQRWAARCMCSTLLSIGLTSAYPGHLWISSLCQLDVARCLLEALQPKRLAAAVARGVHQHRAPNRGTDATPLLHLLHVRRRAIEPDCFAYWFEYDSVFGQQR